MTTETDHNSTATPPSGQAPSAAASLETIIDTTPSSSVETSPSSQVQLLPLDEYVSRFSNRYKTEKVFQNIVHKYLKLGKVDKVKLGFGKMFRKEWYAQKTETLIHEYALKIRTSIEEALQVQQDLQQLEQANQQVSKVKTEVDTIQQQEQQQLQTYQAEAEQQRKQDLLIQIQQKPAAAEIIKQKLAEKLEASGYLKKDHSGNISFNESRIVDRLGEMFLNEIVQEIEDTDGRGFMNQVQTAYTGLISHWAELEDLIELPSVDWVQTIIYSRSKGYRVPQFPHYITGKAAEENQRIRVAKCVNAAMVVDSSGSMKENNRFEMAKKTVLGTRAMMRNLDNKNEIDIAHYQDKFDFLAIVRAAEGKCYRYNEQDQSRFCCLNFASLLLCLILFFLPFQNDYFLSYCHYYQRPWQRLRILRRVYVGFLRRLCRLYNAEIGGRDSLWSGNK